MTPIPVIYTDQCSGPLPFVVRKPNSNASIPTGPGSAYPISFPNYTWPTAMLYRVKAWDVNITFSGSKNFSGTCNYSGNSLPWNYVESYSGGFNAQFNYGNSAHLEYNGNFRARDMVAMEDSQIYLRTLKHPFLNMFNVAYSTNGNQPPCAPNLPTNYTYNGDPELQIYLAGNPPAVDNGNAVFPSIYLRVPTIGFSTNAPNFVLAANIDFQASDGVSLGTIPLYREANSTMPVNANGYVRVAALWAES